MLGHLGIDAKALLQKLRNHFVIQHIVDVFDWQVDVVDDLH
jgi:hypothetical protein